MDIKTGKSSLVDRKTTFGPHSFGYMTRVKKTLIEQVDSFVNYVNHKHSKVLVLSINVSNNQSLLDMYGWTVVEKIHEKLIDHMAILETYDLQVVSCKENHYIAYTEVSLSESCQGFADQILYQLMDKPLWVDGYEIYCAYNIGIAESRYWKKGDSSIELINRAIDAMIHRQNSKNIASMSGSVLFDYEMRENEVRHNLIQTMLKDACHQGELYLEFQPLLDSKTDQITCLEALVRWENSDLGLVRPDEFIAIAEASKTIVPIGMYIMSKALKRLKLLQEAGYEMKMLVNVSVVQLMQASFYKEVDSMLRSMKIAPKDLELEITESVMIDDNPVVMNNLHALKSLGVTISLDDFGTGYNSFVSIQKDLVTSIKIDKSFVWDIDNQSSRNIIETVLFLGGKLSATITGEGIEDAEQYKYLKTLGCQRLQGYYISKPLKGHLIQGFIETRKRAS